MIDINQLKITGDQIKEYGYEAKEISKVNKIDIIDCDYDNNLYEEKIPGHYFTLWPRGCTGNPFVASKKEFSILKKYSINGRKKD